MNVQAIGYPVSAKDYKHLSYTAQQTLELRCSDGTALLDLAGQLQKQGLAAALVDWQLQPALHRKAHNETAKARLKDLQTRAASAAATLTAALSAVLGTACFVQNGDAVDPWALNDAVPAAGLRVVQGLIRSP